MNDPHQLYTLHALTMVGVTQFEPESFVDGLLGIGVAGGKSGKAARTEGAMLASRLVEMRQERERRAQQTKMTAAKTVSPEPNRRVPATASPSLPQQKANRPKSNKNKKRKSKT